MASISLGTDCTGIDAAYYAVKRCLPKCVKLDYKFASDVIPEIRNYLAQSCNPTRIYTDCTTRKQDDVPEVDIYIAGFRCQSFSRAGARNGTNEPRGCVVFHLIEYLQKHPPKIFILENVVDFMHGKMRGTFEHVMQTLSTTLPNFHVTSRRLSPLDIGFPHQRKRLFIIGVANGISMNLDLHASYYPTSLTSILLNNLEAQEIDPQSYRTLTTKGEEQLKRHDLRAHVDCSMPICMVNVGLSKKFGTHKYVECSPCLTRFACSFYIVNQGRFLTAVEALRLQGFDDSTVATYLRLFDPGHDNKMRAFLWAGNSICIPLLQSLLHPLIDQLLAK